jgi:hypothetical protein
MSRKLSSKSFVTLPDGSAVLFNSLSAQEKQMLHNRLQQRLSLEMSLYYTQNPNEYIRLCQRTTE